MNADLLFMNNKTMEAVGVLDMRAAMHDVERVYVLNAEGDVINPGKCVLRWGKTVEDENVMGRINAMPGFIGGEYQMAGIKWIGSGPMNYKKGLPRASVTVILNDPDTKLPVAVVDGTEISTIALMWRDGEIKDEDLHAELGEILSGRKPGRENDEEIIYFNAVGAGIMDIAVATRCYQEALKRGLGTTLKFWE